MSTIGYLGPKGTFTESALTTYLNRHHRADSPVSINSISDLFASFKSGNVDRIIVPVENSIEGSVTISLDHLVQGENTWIAGEVILPIKQCLLTKAGIDIHQITDVYSHSQPLAQCRSFLTEQLKSAQTHTVSSTAVAAEKVAEKGNGEGVPAVIGNAALAIHYDLEILKDNINDYKHNMTRFVVLSRGESEPSGSDKTSIVFSTKKDQPGSLVDVLNEFSKHNINLTRISSRPTKGFLGEYLFFLDFLGHVKEESIEVILSAIKNKTSYYKYLGSYPIDESYSGLDD
jgi:prephenate dehydratase